MESSASSFNKRFHGICMIKPSPPPCSLPPPLTYLCHFLLFKLNAFFTHLLYFLILSASGFLLIKSLPMRSRPEDFDLFFMSASAATVSSMDTVEMESFSNSQLIVLTILMLLGGEVFTSMLGLLFLRLKSPADKLDVGPEHGLPNPAAERLKHGCIRSLALAVLGYIVAVHAVGYALIRTYLAAFSSSMEVLERKGVAASTFAFFTVVSSFSNCGFLPTNENMIVFRESSGLLLITAALVLAGNTMYPCCLRMAVWGVKRVTGREELEFALRHGGGEVGYEHWMSGQAAAMLAATAAGMLAVQFVVFCCLEWGAEGIAGMNRYRKAVAALFMSVNSRHSGESVVDLSAVAPAVLVLFVVMMYLPPYTTFLPMEDNCGNMKCNEDAKKKTTCFKKLMFSQLSYLAIFIIIICITERRQLSEDPLNFNALNIVIEVISAYGNVGYTTGYSCKRQLRADSSCKDSWIGFSGRWSRSGKLTLIAVMFFGRLKKFSMGGGQAWKLY